MKRNIYLIVGEGRCGKSSLVRALTGVFRRTKKATRIALSNPKKTEIKITVWPQSAQEAQLSPEDVLNDVNHALSENILLVLRFQPHIVPYHANDYINLLIEHHNIVKVIFMGPNDKVQSISISRIANVLNNSIKNPVNENANQVRNWWHWM